MGHLDDVLQLPWLLLHFGSQEERGRSDNLQEAEHHQHMNCLIAAWRTSDESHPKLTFLWNLVKDWTM